MLDVASLLDDVDVNTALSVQGAQVAHDTDTSSMPEACVLTTADRCADCDDPIYDDAKSCNCGANKVHQLCILPLCMC